MWISKSGHCRFGLSTSSAGPEEEHLRNEKLLKEVECIFEIIICEITLDSLECEHYKLRIVSMLVFRLTSPRKDFFVTHREQNERSCTII